MSQGKSPAKQLSLLLPIANPKEAQIREQNRIKKSVEESRARLIADLRSVGL